MIAVQTADARLCPRCETDAGFLNLVLTPDKIDTLVKEIPLSESLAADSELCRNRLSVCGTCESLSEEVLCSHCGCFVQFRARIEKSYCPNPSGDKWSNIWPLQIK